MTLKFSLDPSMSPWFHNPVKLPSKRLFIVLSLLISGCVSDGVTFKNDSLGSANYKTKTISGQVFKPEGTGPFPAVVLLPHCGGTGSNLTSLWPNFLTANGYVVMFVDFFGSRGAADCRTSASTFAASKIEMANDAYGARDYLAGRPDVDGKRIAVMGFSIGAVAVNNTLVRWRSRDGRADDFQAAIAAYGHCQEFGFVKPPYPVLEIFGTNDDRMTVNSCSGLNKRFDNVEVRILEGAYHAFDQPEANGKSDVYGTPMRYSADATRDAQQATLAFLAKHLANK